MSSKQLLNSSPISGFGAHRTPTANASHEVVTLSTHTAGHCKQRFRSLESGPIDPKPRAGILFYLNHHVMCGPMRRSSSAQIISELEQGTSGHVGINNTAGKEAL